MKLSYIVLAIMALMPANVLFGGEPPQLPKPDFEALEHAEQPSERMECPPAPKRRRVTQPRRGEMEPRRLFYSGPPEESDEPGSHPTAAGAGDGDVPPGDLSDEE